jgi:hypothetical protein
MKPATALQHFITDIPCLDDSADAMETLADNAFPCTDPGSNGRARRAGQGRLTGRSVWCADRGFTRFLVSTRRQRVFNRKRGCGGYGVEAMQALTLMIVYVLTTAMVQIIGFLISRVVDYEYPTLGLMTFLVLFLGAFGVAWPIAVRITEWLIRRAGHVVETEQSGGDARRDVAPRKAAAR